MSNKHVIHNKIPCLIANSILKSELSVEFGRWHEGIYSAKCVLHVQNQAGTHEATKCNGQTQPRKPQMLYILF